MTVTEETDRKVFKELGIRRSENLGPLPAKESTTAEA
jgi:hypothetical protein